MARPYLRQAIFAAPYTDWDAPTGGYLLTACLASGRVVGQAVLARCVDAAGDYPAPAAKPL